MIAPARGYSIRTAQPADNAALVALAAASPMEAGLTICVRRDPDFFALNRLQGDRWEVGVVESPWGGVVGCIGVAERLAYVRGVETRTAYVSDLKVHPAHRGRRVADELTHYAREFSLALGAGVPCLLTALAGNHGIEGRASGPRGLPQLHRFATVQSYAIPLFLPRREPRPDQYRVLRASAADLEEMTCLWHAVARERQFAPVQFALPPGLAIENYWLARRAGTGRLAGFVALWDQEAFKRTYILRYGARLGALRTLLNLSATLFSAPRLPAAGAAAPLKQLAAFQLTVPWSEPGALRALLERAYADFRRSQYAVITLGLDVRDPLSRALDGLLVTRTALHAYVSTPAGVYRGPDLADRPLHFETALV